MDLVLWGKLTRFTKDLNSSRLFPHPTSYNIQECLSISRLSGTMYAPAPPRRKKTNITRSRTGCQSCRQRRKKCDGANPCGTCLRLGRLCEPVAIKPQFRLVEFKSATDIPQTNVLGFNAAPPVPAALALPIHDQSVRHAERFAPLDCAEVFSEPALPHVVRSSAGAWNLEVNAVIYDRQAASGIGVPNPRTKRPLSHVWRTVQPPAKIGDALSILPVTNTFLSIPIRLDKDQFYHKIWQDQCVPALHVAFCEVDILRSPPQVITNAISALSACHLSRIRPQRKHHRTMEDPGRIFRPDVDHQTISREFYGSAIHSVVRWSRSDYQQNLAAALAVLILFCHLESMMSGFQDFAIHSNAVELLLEPRRKGMTTWNEQVKGLLAAWAQSRLHNWWKRAHFTTSSFFTASTSLIVEPLLLPGLDRKPRIQPTILSIMCESYRLNCVAFIHLCDRITHPHPMLSCSGETRSMDLSPSGTQTLHRVSPLTCSRTLLRGLKQMTTEWYDGLQLYNLPNGQECHCPSDDEHSSLDLTIKPMRFQSHVSAMNYAYYVVARIMQQTEYFEALTPSGDRALHTGGTETEMWILVLLRIAAGIDWDECKRLNIFTVGISGLLLAATLRSRSPEIGLWIQRWLERRAENSLEEGSFPVWQIIRILRVINQERRAGRDVFAVFQPVDDGGGVGKHDSYNSQTLTSILIYGKDRSSGTLYTTHLAI
ncbi:hypothetical protein BKA67DRAFT_6195 [Truncatella angustata]|uniref:Zn(2)-C6 fungal-type domain-containing protein n=1 Tax=Truncatella angustata TaxID=152316 RepID=A0A9P8UVS7_9PEZI|nr:uncharacterized protein BKA67DRAFT_6195 [Truncatella angustata]KAH6659108.1 hypothetical protein BKA67DRAFT_6195 [Truncatella angustata]